MWDLDHKKGKVLKNWCFQTVVLEKTLESPLDRKKIKPTYPKRNQPWILIGRTDAEDPILWPPDVNSQLIGKDPHAGKDWGQEEKGAREDEMVGWHHSVYMNTAQEPPWDSPLGCILRTWKKFDPENLRKKRLTFFLQQNLEPVQIEEIWKMAFEWHTKL